MITQKIDLNLIPGRVLPRVNVSQYDKGTRTLEFTIYNGDVSFDPTSYTAYIQGFKPDGHGFNYTATITSQKITADVTEQMTAVCGEVTCEVIIMDGTDRIGTGNFILNVERAAMPDDAQMSDSDYAYIEQLIEDAQQAAEDAQAEVENAEAWANGTRDGQAIPATDPAYQKNSKYWSEQSDTYAQKSSDYSEDAEAWAVGTRNGTPVPSGSPEYENNAAYWANEARNVAQQTTYTATDDSLALAPTSAGNALPIAIYGQSTQNGTPTPSAPVAIESASADFKCVGKNLIPYPYYWENGHTYRGITFTYDLDGVVKANGTVSGTVSGFRINGETYSDGLILKAGNYILSGCPSGGSSSTYRMAIRKIDSNNASTSIAADIGSGISFTISQEDANSYRYLLYCDILSGQTVSNLTFKPMLRLASVADETYEPYKHTDITTNLTLRAIEVSSTDPYNLVKDGHYYIADTIDWDEVDGYQITRRIKEVIFNGSEAWTKTANNCNVEVNDYLKQPATSMPYVRSTQYKPALRSTGTNDDNYISALQASEAQNLISIRDTTHQSSLSDFTTWLSNNNLTVMYALREHTTEAVSSAQAKALLSMRTYEESTSIDAVNSPAPILELEYAKTRTPALALTGHNMAHINAIDIGDM